MAMRSLDHLELLEHEAIYIVREAVALFPRLALLFSGGKDSLVLAHVARKALAPLQPQFPLLHIDTGHNFPETLEFRDAYVRQTGWRLEVRSVEASIAAGRVQADPAPHASRNHLQSVTLTDAIRELNLDACLGGARRDEEKARAKERVFSHRNRDGRWEPQHQRPELWHLVNGHKAPGEHFRVFPLSNWTELDVWSYIRRENLALPSLYFAHERRVVNRSGTLLALPDESWLQPGEELRGERVRFRTIGDMTCTGAVRSAAQTLDEVMAEVAAARQTERAARADDQRSDAAMEDRKREGYF
ncbi:MAG: sulfate adenylyltransferase subunit 2 [Opitutae bacterium]|nr:sulfate adenylyltransferase subunit 2 [Opitutae bacterium]